MNGYAPIYRVVTCPNRPNDPRSAGFVSEARALGIQGIQHVQCNDLYFLQGNLEPSQLEQIASSLLCDPVTESVDWRASGTSPPFSLAENTHQIEVGLRPGVTDPVAEQILRAAHEIGIAALQNASTGKQFIISGRLEKSDLHHLAGRLLANPVIQCYALGEIEPIFPQPAEASTRVEILPIRNLDSAGLLALSVERRAALDLAEMEAIQAYFRAEGRDCSDVELEMIAQTWSEHCVHKTFKACVEVEAPQPSPYPPLVNNLLDTYIRRATEEIAAPWVISAFSDNAGIIEFGPDCEVSIKVETHNHPSAIEPFGGANTGVGGVIRDILGVSAKPIAATDVLCFGPLDADTDDLPGGVFHPQRIFSGVVSGVQDYGNKMGIPTVNGAVWFDPGYTANPLVYCGCVGIAPRGLHRRAPLPGDRVIVLGGKTGRDGLRGATFSSMVMDAQTGEVAGASVQIGAPITEKTVMEVLLRARDEELYHAVTDCGAGGLSSAVGEMAAKTGADVDLARVPLKYAGLAPWEIWLSEAQERMVCAVPAENQEKLRALCDLFDVEMSDIGAFTGNGRLVVRYHQQKALDLETDFLHHGLPQRRLAASPPGQATISRAAAALPDFSAALLALLAHPNIASREAIIRVYDHEVQGGTCVKPLAGPGNGPSDACVLKPMGAPGLRGIVLSNGFNPEYGKIDPYRMALGAVDEAIRNAVAVGADPDHLALLDNFCWGNPLRAEMMWALLESARGCYEGAVANRSPFISGKDSFNNEYTVAGGLRQAIPPSLLITALATLPNVERAVTMDLKQPGATLYLAGEFRPAFGGSHFASCFGMPAGAADQVPQPGLEAPALYRALFQAMQSAGSVNACHDLSEGGFAVAAAEMCIASGLGAALDLPAGSGPYPSLFGETAGCLLVEVAPGREEAFERFFLKGFLQRVGQVVAQPAFAVSLAGEPLFSLPVADLAEAWRTPLIRSGKTR
ncbi:MAG TPA: phosphoribosylformylglycinamidine synthase subunit PurL [Anaerolineaceae bacterium]|nr:phosphoribosylformylglycinamidine synthase subunit PurL [Anaerolineaceae bacterium]